MGRKTTIEEKATAGRRVQIMRMKYIQRKTAKQIARELGISADTVWATIKYYKVIFERATVGEAVADAIAEGYL